MHSRRPPALRHKGKRRLAQKRAPHEQEQEDHVEPSTTNGASTATTTTTTTNRKKKSGLCQRFLIIGVLFLGFFLYARFVLLSSSKMGGDSNLRGAAVGVGVMAEKQTDESIQQNNNNNNGIAQENGDEEEEDQEWKNLVKGQTTKD